MSQDDPAPPPLTRHGPPRLRARFGDLALPHVALGTFPTPVEPLEGLSRELGAEVWIKRDDRSGVRYGGNKVRKLELILAHALARGRRAVVTMGAYGSHHALATGIYARALGLEAHLVLNPQPITPHVLDDLLADQAVGAQLAWVPHPAMGPPVMQAIASWVPRCDVIPGGGSSALGAIGYVEAGLELAAQVEEGALPAPDLLFVAAGTCGTVAGLALGLELAGLPTRVVGVRVVPAVVTNMRLVDRLRCGAARILRRAGAPVRTARHTRRAEIDPHELGPGYGHETPAAAAAMARFAAEGIELETTYTGKAAAALLRRARGAERGQRLLFWHTFSSADLAPLVARADPRAVPRPFQAALRAGGRV